MREDTVFGPIHSRRLGSSLGINLLPRYGKICNFDCIYCECGWNADGRSDTRMPKPEEVAAALEAKLSLCRDGGVSIDSITFSGDGEPTLNPGFAEIIDITLALRDRYYPGSAVSVLSNATTLGREDVFRALRKVDNPILKLDAATTARALVINRPAGAYDVGEVIRNMERFEGDFVLQTMFLRTPSWASEDMTGPWSDIVRKLRPREIMVYTIDRETPMAGLEKYTASELLELVRPLIDEGFNIKISA